MTVLIDSHESSSVYLRPATTDDDAAIRSVHRRSIEAFGPAAYDDAQVRAWAAGTATADYAATITDPEVVARVAVDEDTDGVVGFGTARLAAPTGYAADPDAEITGIYVAPAAARQGVGTALADALEARITDHGAATVGLWASLNAVAFYAGRGYERVCEHDHEFSSDLDTGVTGTVVEMGKSL